MSTRSIPTIRFANWPFLTDEPALHLIVSAITQRVAGLRSHVKLRYDLSLVNEKQVVAIFASKFVERTDAIGAKLHAPACKGPSSWLSFECQ
jgi:hypothetical protein